MSHQIKIYQSDWDKLCDGPTPIFWLNVGLGVGSIASLITLTAFWPVLVAVWTVHLMLWLTNERFGMDRVEVDYWKKYRSLPKEYQNSVRLDPKYLKALNNGVEWNNLKNAIDKVYDANQERRRIELSHEGDAYIRALTQARKDEAESLRIATEVKEEMKAKELTV